MKRPLSGSAPWRTTGVDRFQRLPVVNFSVIPQRLWGGPIYAALDSQFTNFHRNDGSRGERFILNPALSFFRVLPAGLELAAQGGYQLRFYNANNAGVADGTSGVGLGWANASLATPLERVYEINDGNLKRLRHTLVPAIGYTLTQERNQENLPLFDYDDRPLGQQLLGWSLTSYLTGRYATPSGAPDYRELLFLRLSQGYQLSGSRRDLLNLADAMSDAKRDSRSRPRALRIARCGMKWMSDTVMSASRALSVIATIVLCISLVESDVSGEMTQRSS